MDTLASIYHDLMGLEQLSGDFHTAVRHGWRAVNHYRSEIGRTRCMAGLAGVLRDLGDLDAAEDAYTLVAGATEEQYFRIYAAEGLAYVAALRGDADGYARWTTSSDELGWERGPLSAKAEILFFRGLGLRSLGQFDQARRWLSNAVQYASDNGFSRVLFRAEAALESLDLDDVTEDGSTPAPPEVRDGLRAMRMAMAGG